MSKYDNTVRKRPKESADKALKYNLFDVTWGVLQKTGFETYLPVGTFPRGWYVSLVFHASRAQ